MMRRVTRWLAGGAERPVPARGYAESLAAAGVSFETWFARRRADDRLYCELDSAQLAELRMRHPGQAELTCRRATDYADHRFDILGSGDFRPADPDRPRHADGYQPIDWYLDPVRALRFPRNVPHKEWDLYRMRPGNADIKYPWELARCQHWAILGQAFLISGDTHFAQELLREAVDFMDANPVGRGVNWTCTMDVALRAANWAVGLALIKSAPALPAAWEAAYDALFAHGLFIRDNLEDKYEVTSNHFLSNVVGLFFLGRVFTDLPEGRNWERFARDSLEREIDVQVLPDGADFESSIPYHRLVLELFLGALRLADHSGTSLSKHYRSRVHAMARFLWSTLRPDGCLPQVGDADDGRLHIFTATERPHPQDGTHLVGPAAQLFHETAWLAGLPAAADWESTWWGLAGQEVAPTPRLGPVAALFADSGIAVLRDEATYLLVTNGPVGTKGFGNHKHNDQLSFEFHADGTAWIVDPGSYVYTADFAARNRFRATAAHNTLLIDGLEQNEFKPEWLFRMFAPAAAPRHLAWRVDATDAVYEGCHEGYRRLLDVVTHQRQLRLRRGPRALLVVDGLTGTGRHRVEWTFQCGPAVRVARHDHDTVWLQAAGRQLVLTSLDGLDARVEAGAYSSSYGASASAPRVRFAVVSAVDARPTWRFLLAPADWVADPQNTDAVAALVAADYGTGST